MAQTKKTLSFVMKYKKGVILMGSKIHRVLHLLFSIERVEVVVIGQLSAVGDLPKSKKTNPVHSIHRPKRHKLHPGGESVYIPNMIIHGKQPDTNMNICLN